MNTIAINRPHRTRLASAALVSVAALLLSFVAILSTSKPAEAATAPSVWQCNVYRPTLYMDVQNQAGCVAAVQYFLKIAGAYPNLEVDGKYGPITKWTVGRWQDQVNIYADGVVGPQTWKHIAGVCLDLDEDRTCYHHASY